MKKSLIALAVLAAAGAASAQSSVTLFGIVDAGIGRVSGNGASVTGMSNSGINSSRLGFRGREDLGGGNWAGFWLEGQLNNDVGAGASQSFTATGTVVGTTATVTGSGTTGLNFQRRATVSVGGGWGEVRLGRDYVPSFWNTTIFDPFGTNGVGQANTPVMLGAPVRANNSVGYFLPGGIGGIYGQVMYAFGENNSSAVGGGSLGAYTGFRVGWKGGPVDVAGSWGKVKGATSAADIKATNLAGSLTFGAFKPMLVWAEEKQGATKISAWELGLVVTVGAGEIRAAYSDYDLKNSTSDWNKFALGYVHNLSKRTAVYVQYGRVDNDLGSTRTVTNNGLTGITAASGGNSTGYEIGLRHAF